MQGALREIQARRIGRFHEAEPDWGSPVADDLGIDIREVIGKAARSWQSQPARPSRGRHPSKEKVMSNGILHRWQASIAHAFAIFGIGLAGASAGGEDYEDWLGIGS